MSKKYHIWFWKMTYNPCFLSLLMIRVNFCIRISSLGTRVYMNFLRNVFVVYIVYEQFTI